MTQWNNRDEGSHSSSSKQEVVPFNEFSDRISFAANETDRASLDDMEDGTEMDFTELPSKPRSVSYEIGNGLQPFPNSDLVGRTEYGDFDETSVSDSSIQLEGYVQDAGKESVRKECGKIDEHEKKGFLARLGIFSLISAIGGLGLFAWLQKPSMVDEDGVMGVVKELRRGAKIAADTWGGGGGVSASIP